MRCLRIFAAALLLALAVPPCSVWAAKEIELYQARAFVTGQGEVERARGFALCLDEVLVKLSGDPTLIGDRRLAPLETRAVQFVATFAYHDRMSGIPVHDEQGTRERPFDLTVTFDPAKTSEVLHALGREPWLAPRPRLVMVVGIRDATAAYVLAQDGERGLGQRQSIAAAAFKRGMPVVLPDTAALAAERVSFDAVAAEHSPFLDALAQRAGGDVPLAGTLIWDEPALGWTADWRLSWHGETHHWRIMGVSFDDAFRSGIGGAMQIVSDHGSPS